MAEFDEVFSDLKSNGKKLFKDKKFIVLCVVVGLVALVMWAIKQNRAATTEETTEETGYITYGYPYGADDGYSDYDWFYDKMDSLQSMYDENLAKQDEKYQTIIDQMNDKYDQMLDKYDQLMENMDRDDSGDYDRDWGTSSGGGDDGSSVDEQAVIDAMQQNANAWWDVTSQSGRDQLHDANLYLGGMIGAQYDDQSGMWYKDGKPLFSVDRGDAIAYVTDMGSKGVPASEMTYTANVDYQSAINNAIMSGASASVINDLNTLRDQKISASGKTSAQANQSFDANTDYQALINKAKQTGADQSVIDNLTAQRNAKIAAQNADRRATGAKVGTATI